MSLLVPAALLVLAALAARLTLVWGRGRQRSAARQRAYLAALAAPAGVLGVGLVAWHLTMGQQCLLTAPLWEHVAALALPLHLTANVLLAAALAGLRLLAAWVQLRPVVAAPKNLQALADAAADALGTPAPRVFISPASAPQAFAVGLRRPRVVLSVGLLARCDAVELHGVLAHEVAHAARRDPLLAWAVLTLRDAFWFIPDCRRAWTELMAERELDCDDLAVQVTRRPLALASALLKALSPGTPPQAAVRLVGMQPLETVERRLALLVRRPDAAPPGPLAVRQGLPLAGVPLLCCGALLAGSALMLSAAGCGLL